MRLRWIVCLALVVGSLACEGPPIEPGASPELDPRSGAWQLRAGAIEVEVADARLQVRGGGSQVTLRTETIRVGASPIALDRRGSAVDGAVVVQTAAGVEERVRARSDGTIEQTWHFESRPAGEGPVRLAIALEGDARIEGVDDRGVLIASGGIPWRYGHGTWIDARGARTPVTARVDAESIVLEIDEGVLARTVWPAVLDPILGPEIAVGDTVTSPTLRAETGVGAAGNGSIYLVAWSTRSESSSRGEIRVGRFDASGAAMDGAGLVVASEVASIDRVGVATDGTDFLVSWSGFYASAPGARLVRADGTLGPLTGRLSIGGEHMLGYDGTQYVAMSYAGTMPGYVRVSRAGVLLDTAVLPLTGGYAFLPDIACGEAECMLAYVRDGVPMVERLVAGLSGARETPVAAATSAIRTSIAWNGTHYGLLFEDADHALRVARVTPARALEDGPSGVAITAPSTPVATMDIATSGTSWVTAWVTEAPSTYVTTAYARTLDAGLAPLGPAVDIGVAGERYYDVAFGSHPAGSIIALVRTQAMATTDLVGTIVPPTGAIAPLSSLVTAPQEQTWVELEAGGGGFFAAWEDRRDPGSSDVYGARLRADGTVIDTTSIAISRAAGEQLRPRVAWDGQQFVVVWVDRRSGTHSDVRAARVRDGVLLDPDGIAVAVAANEQDGTAIAGIGTETVVAWRDNARAGSVFLARIARDGTVRDPAGVATEVRGLTAALAWGPSGLLVAGMESFGADLRWRIFSPALVPISSVRSASVSGPGERGVAAVAVGSGYLIVSGGVTVVPIDATGSNGARRYLGPYTSGVDATFDGRDVIIAYDEAGATLTVPRGLRSTPTGRALGSSFALAPEHVGVRGPAVASLGDRRALVAYLVDREPRSLGDNRLHVRTLSFATNGTPCTSPTDCESGFCTDGVCCDMDCGSAVINDCQACSAARGASADGVCTAVADGRVCRTSAGPCDLAETCDGSSRLCPADAVRPRSHACREATQPCDVAESCDGLSPVCPTDRAAGADRVCRPSRGRCDIEDRCDGASFECRSDNRAFEGTPCGDGLLCNGVDTCNGSGECVSPGSPCDDGDVCTAESCDEATGCRSVPIAGCCRSDFGCDDGDPCTRDLCVANTCRTGPGSCGADGGSIDAGAPRDAGAVDSGPVLPVDAAAGRDGGPDGSDAAPGSDGGSGPTTPGGCACRAGGSSGPAGPIALAVVALALLGARRRRGVAGMLALVVGATVAGCSGPPDMDAGDADTMDAGDPVDAQVTADAPMAPDSGVDAPCPGCLYCEGRWIPPDDPEHCGACGRACSAGTECRDGSCRCGDGSLACGTTCYDGATDPSHCGACDVVCPAGQTCEGGACVCPIAGQRLCGGPECIDISSNAEHCGACGNACPWGVACVAGRCECSRGRIVCGDACVDPELDSSNCGGCGRVCPSGATCTAGTCSCGDGLAACADGCFDLTRSPLACGACGRTCAAGQTCVLGDCYCPGGQVVCDGRCVDVARDPASCGECGLRCPSGATCTGGSCVCPAGQTACGSACVDLQTSTSHCGGCGAICATGATCDEGLCACPSGESVCGTECTDVTSDVAHCGTCGRSCSLLCASGDCDEIADLSLGRLHGCAITTLGQVRCWGSNAWGMIGDGTTGTRTIPVETLDLRNVVELATYSYIDATLARTGDGSVWCWGQNDQYVCANPSLDQVLTRPYRIPGLPAASALAIGSGHACIASTGGEVWCWGDNDSGELGLPPGAPAHTYSPVRVPGITGVVALTAGVDFTCALRSDRTVWCWGRNDEGQLADGTLVDRSAPAPTIGLASVAEITAGLGHACARRTDGIVLCWGFDMNGQLGDGGGPSRATPVPVIALGPQAQVVAGFDHVCARNAAGTVVCWGSNGFGQLGDDTSRSTGFADSTAMLAGPAIEIAAGSYFTCARLSSARSQCWGTGFAGQLGRGSTAESLRPVDMVWAW